VRAMHGKIFLVKTLIIDDRPFVNLPEKRPRAGARRVSPMRSTEADWSTPHCPGVRLTSDQSSSGEGGRHHCECRNAAEAAREILRQDVPINEVSRKDFPFSECHSDRLQDR
jgi:hypothetical protein